MISPQQYAELLWPFDVRIAERFGCLGIHNCAWRADPYIDHYASVPNLAYIDMGIGSDLQRAREAFPDTRRAVMYTPMDLAGKPLGAIRADMDLIARDYAPCDLVLADVEYTTSDRRVLDVMAMCQ
jgi:hypothetical protein